MLSLSQITAIADACGNAASTWSSSAMKSAAQRRPSRYTHAPVLTSSAPNTVICRFLPGVGTCGRAVRSVQLARTCGSRFRWVSSSASTTARRGSSRSRATMPATTWSWCGSPRAVSFGRRQIATSRTRRYSVRRLTCGQPRYCRIRVKVHGPGQPSRAAMRPVSRRPPSGGRPDRGRSASPASPSSLNRPIHRRTVAGWQSSNSAIWDGANPCADSSTITARAASRHRPRRSASSNSISLPGPLANTLTGRILITTSPAGWTLCGNFDPTPGEAAVNALHPPVSQRVTRRTSG